MLSISRNFFTAFLLLLSSYSYTSSGQNIFWRPTKELRYGKAKATMRVSESQLINNKDDPYVEKSVKRGNDEKISDRHKLCISEECVQAAATILTSLDRSTDPCEDFYHYACGGWIEQSITPQTDRFTVVDKRNQNLIIKLLETPTDNVEDNIQQQESAINKAKNFFKSCMTEDQDFQNMQDLASIISYAGGWALTGNSYSLLDQEAPKPKLMFNHRLQIIHNTLGRNVFFTWGVIEHQNENQLAVIAGGWNDGIEIDNSSENQANQEYLKLMTMYTMLLAQVDQDFTFLNFTVNNEYATYDNTSSNGPISSSAQYRPHSGKSVSDSTTGFEDPANHLNNLNSINDVKMVLNSTNFLPNLEENLLELIEVQKKIEAELLKVIQFEASLADIHSKTAEDNKRLQPLTLQRLQHECPFLDWQAFFNFAFRSMKGEHENMLSESGLSNDTLILVQADFIRGVNSLVTRIRKEENGDQVLINYMIWRVIAGFYPNLPLEISRKRERCVKETEEIFAPAITAIFIHSKGINKSDQVVNEVKEIVRIMKKAFKDNLQKLSWMSPASKEAAEAKLDQMSELIGYPDFALNSTWIDEHFAGLNIKQDRYVENLVSHGTFTRNLELQQYFKPSTRREWQDYSASISIVNAYYNQVTNTMVVPIGMLQPPLFWPKPKALTFGAFGIIIAHEITHAFDDAGLLYNSADDNKPLYDNETLTAFHSSSDCIKNQYSRFQINGISVNGSATLGENIADHGGLKIAETAYSTWLHETYGRLEGSSLPALEDFSDWQLFYLGYAMPWCAVHTEDMMKSFLAKDEHAPEMFRVIGPLSNSIMFSKTWNCPYQSNMNPKEKCLVW